MDSCPKVRNAISICVVFALFGAGVRQGESLDSIQVGLNVLQCIAVCCSVLRCFAVCYSVLCCSMLPSPNPKTGDDAEIVCFRLCSAAMVAGTLQQTATHCNTLQHTATL